jgi:hypothetical protein
VSRLVRESGRPARIDHGDPGGAASTLGIRSAVGAPITVAGRLWGLAVAASAGQEAAPGTAARLVGFTELVETAIANAQAQAQAELAASRARIVATADQTRRIERDLHDGA